MSIFVIIIYSFRVFHIIVSWWFFHWSLSDSKSPQVSRTLLSILTVLNNAVVWMVSVRPSTSKFSGPFNSPLVTVPNAPITISIIVTFMFHSFFKFPSKVDVLILLFTFFNFYSVVSQYSKVDNFASSLFFFFFFLLITQSLVFWSILGDPFVCQSPIGDFLSFFKTAAGLCIYHFFE